jgi:IS5 family transposase
LVGPSGFCRRSKRANINKLYALHAPEVKRPAKGKARKPYEFGVKVSITTTHKKNWCWERA